MRRAPRAPAPLARPGAPRGGAQLHFNADPPRPTEGAPRRDGGGGGVCARGEVPAYSRSLTKRSLQTGAPRVQKQARSVKKNKTRSDARVDNRTEASAGAQTCGAPVRGSAHTERPARRKALFGGLVCACPCGCASRTTVASQEQPLFDSDGAELCSECFGNISGLTNTLGTLCRLFFVLKSN